MPTGIPHPGLPKGGDHPVTLAPGRYWIACVALMAVGLAAAAVSSCVGPTFIVQQYAGSPRPAEQIAIVRLHGNSLVQLASFDREAIDVPLAKDARLHIEVLPGPHEAQIAAPERGLNLPLRVRFMAEAGKVYRPVIRPKLARAPAGDSAKAVKGTEANGAESTELPKGDEPQWEALFYEVDRSSDEQIRIAAEPPDAPPASATSAKGARAKPAPPAGGPVVAASAASASVGGAASAGAVSAAAPRVDAGAVADSGAR